MSSQPGSFGANLASPFNIISIVTALLPMFRHSPPEAPSTRILPSAIAVVSAGLLAMSLSHKARNSDATVRVVRFFGNLLLYGSFYPFIYRIRRDMALDWTSDAALNSWMPILCIGVLAMVLIGWETCESALLRGSVKMKLMCVRLAQIPPSTARPNQDMNEIGSLKGRTAISSSTSTRSHRGY